MTLSNKMVSISVSLDVSRICFDGYPKQCFGIHWLKGLGLGGKPRGGRRGGLKVS